MATSSVVTVTTTPTPFNSADDPDGQGVEVYNNSAATVYYGGPDVTTGTGVPIAPSTSRAWDLAGSERVYGVVASGTAECRVARLGTV